MNIAKLFGVLVVGGSMLVTGACTDTDGGDQHKPTGPDAKPDVVDANTTGDDANMSLADANSTGADATTSKLAPCFCDSDACCDNGTLQFGFECCWGSTC